MSILENLSLNMNIANNTSGTQKGSGSFANAKNEIMKDMALKLLEALSNNESGSTLELNAQVRDILQNQIVLTLPDNSVISGRTDTLLPLSIGDNATFAVSLTQEGQVTLSLLSTPDSSSDEQRITADNPLVKKALNAANIPANSRSLQVTSELLNAGQSVNTANIRKFITLSLKNPDIPIKELVLLDANKVPLTQENLTAFKEIAQGSAVWPSVPTESASAEVQATPLSSSQQPEAHAAEKLPTTDNASPQSEALTSKAPAPETTSTVPVAESYTASEAPSLQTSSSAPESPAAAESPELQSASQASKPQPTEEDPLVQTSTTSATASANLPAESKDSSPVPKENRHVLPASIEPKDFSEEAVKKFYSALKNSEEATGRPAGKQSLSSEQPLLHEKTATESMEKAVQNNLQTASTADKIQFMQDINNVFPFIQIPVKLQEENAKGELYVFEKKKKYNPDEPLTAVLHLELDSLGTTDIKVSLIKDKVSAFFEVADSDAVKFFQDEIPGLSERLSKLGFSLSSDFKVKEAEAQEKPLLYQFLEAHSPKNYSRYTFDVHA